MKCQPCNGSGLISDYEVCATCKGLGHDGSFEPETVVEKIKKAVKKATKRK